jgi:GNAT superfamily N-acetyltransferase
MRDLSREQLAYLTEVDHHDHEALVALDPDSGEGLGVARFVRLGDAPDVAEAAVAIVDHWQDRGLGTALLGALADRARAEGIRSFRCLVLADNEEMIELLRTLGPPRETSRQPGAVEFEVDLELPEEGIGAELAILLRTAAARAIEPLFHRITGDRAIEGPAPRVRGAPPERGALR